MRKLLIGLALSLLATAASAEWVLVIEEKDGDNSYADPVTKRQTGNFVRIWEILDYKNPNTFNGKPYYSVRTYTQYDCAERTSQILQLTLFSGKMATGESVTNDQPENKKFVAPRTNGEIKLDFACK